ncbi:DUF1178 family protein [Qipengyuania sp. JC766]|uniref:DUF1178 family protein n=1 Tax=Qipengyuania sp. JC766 TaxID=3232139 RepID=UPI003458CF60
MIVFDLKCDNSHRFECWFKSSGDFEEQSSRGLVSCPQCGSGVVAKAPMAPAVPKKSAGEGRRNRLEPKSAPADQPLAGGSLLPEVAKALQTIAKAQAKALEKSTWVGEKFADKARAMHYGEADEAPIHGRASRDDAEALLEEGITVAPILFPIAPPDEVN